MKWEKLKQKMLRTTIKILLAWSTLKLSQETLDFFNHKELTEYENIIDDFVESMKEQGIEEPVEIFDYYNYALWNGYLSNTQEYQYNGGRDLFLSNPGLSCVTGSGVCLNKADFLAKIYEEYGYDAYTVNCYVDVDSNTIINPIRTNSEVERKIANNKATENLEKFVKILKPLTLVVDNHAITCVEYEGEFYYLDPTNLAYLKKVDFNTMEIINSEGSFDIRYLTSAYFWNIGVSEIIPNSDFDYSEMLNGQPVDINIEKLEQFYNENKESYQKVDEQLQKKNQLILYIIFSTIISIGINSIADEIKLKVKKLNNNKLKYNNESKTNIINHRQ